MPCGGRAGGAGNAEVIAAADVADNAEVIATAGADDGGGGGGGGGAGLDFRRLATTKIR